MQSGVSFQDLKQMPLQVWGTLYQHAQAYRLEQFTYMLSVLNPGKDPRKLQRKMLNEINRLTDPNAKENILHDPRKARSFMAGLGVKVIEKPAEAPE